MATWRRDRRFARSLLSRALRGRFRLAAVPLIGLAILTLARVVILPPVAWDTFTYHGVKAATWVQQGRFSLLNGPGPWAYYRNMPAGAEVLTAWAMLPMHDDTLVPLLDAALWIGIGAGAAALSRTLGARGPVTWATAAFVMAIPTIRVELGSAYAELSLMAALLAALACGLSADDRRPLLLTMCGAGLGVAASTKLPMYAVTAVPLALIVGPGLLATSPRPRRAAAMGLAAYVVVLAPWVVSATRDTGGPLSPAPGRVAGVTLGVAPPEVRWYMNRPQEPGSLAARELTALAKVFAPPIRRREQLGILSIVPALLLIAASPGGIGRRWNRAMTTTLAVAIVTVAVFYAPSFTVIRTHWPYSSSRFLLTAVVPLIALVSVCWSRPPAPLVWALLSCALANVLVYATYGMSATSIAPLVVVIVGAGLIGVAIWRTASLLPPIGTVSVAVVLAIAAVAGLQTMRDSLRIQLIGSEFTVGPFQAFWSRVLPFVDDPAMRLRIDVTSGPFQNLDNWLAYPFMGRRLQNEVLHVPTSTDGRFRPFDSSDAPDLARAADKAAWLARLKSERVTHVITFNPPSIELRWMEADPGQFERIDGSKGFWGLFRIR